MSHTEVGAVLVLKTDGTLAFSTLQGAYFSVVWSPIHDSVSHGPGTAAKLHMPLPT